MLKRGLSQVVSVVILIALTISLIGGVFMVTRDYVTTGLSKAGACRDIYEKLSLNPDYTCYDPASNSILFSLSRNVFPLESLLVSVSYDGYATNFYMTDELKIISNLTNYGSNSTVEIISESVIGIENNFNSTGVVNPVSLTIPLTVSGEDRFLLVCIPFENKYYTNVTSVSYGVQPLTRISIIKNDDDSTSELWKLISPPLGGSEVVINFQGSSDRGATAIAYSLNGVNQTDPYREPVPTGSFVNGGDPLEVTITGEEGDLFIDCAGVELGDFLTMGDFGETDGRVQAFNSYIGHYYGASSYMNGSVSETMSWIIDDSAHGATTIGIAIKPSSTSSFIQAVGEQKTSLPRDESGKTYCLVGENIPLKIEIAPKVNGKQCSVVDSFLEIPTCRSELTCLIE